MENQIDEALSGLTETVQDAPNKLYLRATLGTALETLGYETAEITSALDRFFTRTLQ